MSRIGDAFAHARFQGRPALITYLMAGDPGLRATEDLALACLRGGADILELGVPFSDPIADGAEIQRAGQRALRSGTRPRDVVDLASRLRQRTRAPIVLMTYVNPLLAMGLPAFAERAAAAGVDGVIVPDLSLEESDGFRATLEAKGIDHVQLVAPSTSPDRARTIAAASRGFLYVVARYGTTGVRSSLPQDLGARLETLRALTKVPLAVGFGVSTRDHVRALAKAPIDGIVVGSALVRHISEGASPYSVEQFVSGLASGLPGGPTSPALRGSSS